MSGGNTMSKLPVRTYYYRGGVERPTSRGYVWRDGYSANGEDGGALYPWVTKREAQTSCKAIGMRAVFVSHTPHSEGNTPPHP